MFSTISSVSCIYTNVSFHLSASSLPAPFLVDELQELQLRGGKTCAFDSTVIRSISSTSSQPLELTDVEIVLLADIPKFMLYATYTL